MLRICVALLVCTAGTNAQGNTTVDSVRIVADTVGRSEEKSSNGSMDTVVVFNAMDTVHFAVRSRVMRLRGRADVTFRTQKLKAEVIEIDFNESIMKADGVADSNGIVSGFPVFEDGAEEYAGESMIYSFKTKRGRVRFGETNIDGGYYYGSRIKRINENTAYIQDGCFTTCDAPHPHFYFNSPHMKVITNEKIFLDPIVWYVEDIPVFALPIGLYFSAERGRRSGIIMPSPLLSSDRGVVLQNLGYYLAVSDYFDTEVTADLTTKGGFTLYNRSQYSVKNSIDGRVELRFGYTRFNVEQPYSMNIGFSANHTQQFRPNERLILDLLFTTDRLFQNTSLNPLERVKQNARSNASYQRTLYNGMTFNANYVRDQNMINGSVTQNPSLSFAIPQVFPLKGFFNPGNWLGDMQFSFRSNARYSHSSLRDTDTGAFVVKENSVIEHRPVITITPKLGNVTLQPSINYSENWYFQRYANSVNVSDSTIVTTRYQGFFREYTYSIGVNASTYIYGMAYPKILGIAAFRHTLQPIIGLQYSPDQSDPASGFFDRYTSPITGKEVVYSRFGEAGGIATRQKQLLITMGVLNKFSVKPMATDSSEPKPVDVLTFNLNGSYNLAADSLKLSPITFNVRSPMLQGLELSVGGTFNAYDQQLLPDASTGKIVWQTVNSSLISAGKGLARLTNFSVQVGTRFSSQGVSFQPQSNAADTTIKDTTAEDLQSRFSRRLNNRESQVDLFGDHTAGWSDVIIPWDLNLSLSYNRTAPIPTSIVQSLMLSFRGNFSLTQTLTVAAYGSFDFLRGQFVSPVIDINKRVHCWNLSFNWIPIGFNQGFFLRFSAVAPQLKDLVIPKQSTPLYR
ncbi:MAG: LPS-assembly protein LptD [Ignavibacteria bacterium]|nr:LPS-assembly protein LptD [Ignavibacteria bacterium]